MTAHLIRGDARRLPLTDKSVQAIVTSPPYFGLRHYGNQISIWGGVEGCDHLWISTHRPGIDGGPSDKQMSNPGSFSSQGWTVATCSQCQAWRGELGSEETPAAFVAHLVEVCREVWRVMRDDAVFFLNMGSSYAGSGKGPTGHNGLGDQGKRQGFTGNGGMHRKRLEAGAIGNAWVPAPPGIRQKSDMLIPQRLAIALSDDGWIIRQVLIWAKNNPMPESVRDRWTTAHEYVLMLVKQPRYFFDQAGIAEPVTESSVERLSQPTIADQFGSERANGHSRPERPMKAVGGTATRNGRSVWNINTTGYPGAHYAVFSPEIPRRCILAATSEYGACAACGAPWKRLVERESSWPERKAAGGTAGNVGVSDIYQNGVHGTKRDHNLGGGAVQQRGWATTCKCGSSAGVRPCIVLDPFGGSQTTAFVAASMGRIGVGLELSAEYIEQARYGRLAQDFLPFDVPAPEPTALLLPLAPEASA